MGYFFHSDECGLNVCLEETQEDYFCLVYYYGKEALIYSQAGSFKTPVLLY